MVQDPQRSKVKCCKINTKKNENLQSLNQNLLNYIYILERNENASNKGKDISEVKKKSRTLNTYFNKGSKCLMVFQGNWPGIAKRDCY